MICHRYNLNQDIFHESWKNYLHILDFIYYQNLTNLQSLSPIKTILKFFFINSNELSYDCKSSLIMLWFIFILCKVQELDNVIVLINLKLFFLRPPLTQIYHFFLQYFHYSIFNFIILFWAQDLNLI